MNKKKIAVLIAAGSGMGADAAKARDAPSELSCRARPGGAQRAVAVHSD